MSELEFTSSPSDSKGCMHTFHYARGSPSLFIRIKGEQRKNRFLGPTPKLLNQNLFWGGGDGRYTCESILKVCKVSLMTRQAWESHTVHIVHKLCLLKNKNQVMKGVLFRIRPAVACRVCGRTTALGESDWFICAPLQLNSILFSRYSFTWRFFPASGMVSAKQFPLPVCFINE